MVGVDVDPDVAASRGVMSHYPVDLFGFTTSMTAGRPPVAQQITLYPPPQSAVSRGSSGVEDVRCVHGAWRRARGWAAVVDRPHSVPPDDRAAPASQGRGKRCHTPIRMM
ncbi:MAG: hypothetical protein CL424_08305 [Acidimicrobiaceae bacterium]|nr:hypothetical protein [Acidimicrobiaceae bacterium]